MSRPQLTPHQRRLLRAANVPGALLEGKYRWMVDGLVITSDADPLIHASLMTVEPGEGIYANLVRTDAGARYLEQHPHA